MCVLMKFTYLSKETAAFPLLVIKDYLLLEFLGCQSFFQTINVRIDLLFYRTTWAHIINFKAWRKIELQLNNK